VEYLVTDFDSGLAANNALALTGFDSDLGFGADEVAIGPGDSGGPLFIGSAIAGVNAFSARLPIADINGSADSNWGEGSFFTRVSYYRDFIITATGGTVIFVPEPSSTALAIAAAVVAIFSAAKNRCRNPADSLNIADNFNSNGTADAASAKTKRHKEASRTELHTAFAPFIDAALEEIDYSASSKIVTEFALSKS
jgi:hypothetical protein